MITTQQREATKRRIHSQGKTLNQWAVENGFRPIEVYRLLDGTLKGRNGTSHNVAVALGLKKAEAA
jgi:gp16 family phage-associated protein